LDKPRTRSSRASGISLLATAPQAFAEAVLTFTEIA